MPSYKSTKVVCVCGGRGGEGGGEEGGEEGRHSIIYIEALTSLAQDCTREFLVDCHDHKPIFPSMALALR